MRSAILFSLLVAVILVAPSSPAYASGIWGPGVWQGTLGKNKVMVCFNESGQAASYYYQRHLKPIKLDKKDAQGLKWQEKGDTGNWQIDETTKDSISGTWSSDKASTLPLKLKRVVSPDGIQDCSADAYNLPLETRQKIIEGEWKAHGNVESRPLTYGAENTIELKGAAPGIKAINKTLNQKLTSDTRIKAGFAARREMLKEFGYFEFDETNAALSFVNKSWVTVALYRWTAGTGRNGMRTDYLSFSLDDGKPFHPWQWFIDGAKTEQMKHQLPKALRAKFFAGAVPNPECGNSDGSGMYDLLITKDKVGFSEDAIGDGCEHEFSLSAEEAIPFANKRGQSQLKRLK